VTRRRRTDLVLLLIVRRAERDAAMPRRAHSEEPDAPMVIGEGALSTNPELSIHPEHGPAAYPDPT
jgi:hypothetical protein